MAVIIKPPASFVGVQKPTVFLAGTIDQGRGVEWQKRVEERLMPLDWLILNPRREAWAASWEQSIDNLNFRELVEWELLGLETAVLILLYFAPHSQSPISLLEMGLFAHSNKLNVCCPRGFWRKGNVDIVCHRYGIPLTESFEEWLADLPAICQNQLEE